MPDTGRRSWDAESEEENAEVFVSEDARDFDSPSDFRMKAECLTGDGCLASDPSDSDAGEAGLLIRVDSFSLTPHTLQYLSSASTVAPQKRQYINHSAQFGDG